MYKTIKPFIKWAGGKSQLLDAIREKYPAKIERYCEPFVGGGAILLDVLANFQPKEVLINDINHELTNTYIQIRDNAEKVISLLSEMQKLFWNMDNDARKEYFYAKRDKFNELIKEAASTEEKAALFIFINKTCFNGLYRVNSKGLYNVPMGHIRNLLYVMLKIFVLSANLFKMLKYNVEITANVQTSLTIIHSFTLIRRIALLAKLLHLLLMLKLNLATNNRCSLDTL